MPQATQTATKPRTKKRRAVPKPQPSDIQNIPHTLLKPSKLNPRKTFDEAKATELAESIKAQGVLQNLVARKKGKFYEIAAGERRWRAVDDLIKAGELDKDYALPVRVQELSDLELVELATTENAARDDMHPLDEARAFTTMLELGSDAESIALKMGVSLQTVKQRIGLIERLSSKVQTAFAEGELNLSQAQALTLAPHKSQDFLLERILGNTWMKKWSGAEIRKYFENNTYPVKHALFDPTLYTGEITNGLFADDEDFEPHFLDVEQAKRLQTEAIEKLADGYRENWQFAELAEFYSSARYSFVQHEKHDPETQGVLILYHDDLRVVINEGVTRPEAKSSSPSAASSDTEPAEQPKPAKASYTKKLRTEARVKKTQALQTELVGQFRTCLILNIMGLLGLEDVHIGTTSPDSAHYDTRSERAKEVFEKHSQTLQALAESHYVDDDNYPLKLYAYSVNPAEVYSYLKAQDDERLHELFSALTAVRVGSWVDHDVDLGDGPLALALSEDLAIDMHPYVTVDAAHLKLYRKAQLTDIARALGTTYSVEGFKRDALINYILDKPEAKSYLPPVMTFFPKGEAPPTPVLAETLTQDLAKAA